ncbi:hypothetical protein DL767_004067 [Monosporascus sp. MG133]|nr:hypothetical protein DL767_004067 [Monosporascus sp. MG133]
MSSQETNDVAQGHGDSDELDQMQSSQMVQDAVSPNGNHGNPGAFSPTNPNRTDTKAPQETQNGGSPNGNHQIEPPLEIQPPSTADTNGTSTKASSQNGELLNGNHDKTNSPPGTKTNMGGAEPLHEIQNSNQHPRNDGSDKRDAYHIPRSKNFDELLKVVEESQQLISGKLQEWGRKQIKELAEKGKDVQRLTEQTRKLESQMAALETDKRTLENDVADLRAGIEAKEDMIQDWKQRYETLEDAFEQQDKMLAELKTRQTENNNLIEELIGLVSPEETAMTNGDGPN